MTSSMTKLLGGHTVYPRLELITCTTRSGSSTCLVITSYSFLLSSIMSNVMSSMLSNVMSSTLSSIAFSMIKLLGGHTALSPPMT
jgi:ABC-type transport system involved in multi-copper enzyme maturation permease subunit